MKKLPVLVLLGLLPFPIWSQDNPIVFADFAARQQSEPAPSTNFVRFDISFPGGPPARLVDLIETATKKPLNVIVPEEHAAVALPELKLKGVTVPQLFDALGQASRKVISVPNQNPYQPFPGAQQSTTTSYGFRTKGQATPESIWFFSVDAPVSPPPSPTPPPPPEPQKICRFYQLAPYLGELKVEDITTALETAWKMLGEKSTPDLKFHKDTQLLIAVGPPEKLTLIESVLTQLRPANPVGSIGFAPRNPALLNVAPGQPLPAPIAAPIAPVKPRPARSEPENPQPAKP